MREFDSHALRAQLVATAETISVRLWRLTALARQGGPEIASRVGAAAADIAALASAATSELARTRLNAVDELGGLYAVQAMQERALEMIDALERGAVDACLTDRYSIAVPSRPVVPVADRFPASAQPQAFVPRSRSPVQTRPAVRARPVVVDAPQSAPPRAGSRGREAASNERGWNVAAWALPAMSSVSAKRAVAGLAVLAAGGALGWAYTHHAERARAGWQAIAPVVFHSTPGAVAKPAPKEVVVATASAAPAIPEAAPDRIAYAPVLMTGPDARAVQAYFNDLRQSHPDLFATATARVQAVSGEGSGRVYRLTALPLRTKDDALKLCETLRARGVAGCLVRRM